MENRNAGAGSLAALMATLREAVRGGRHDYTEEPIGRAVILLSVPMVMEMAMESLFAVVDVFWVAKLGPDAVATVGLTESMLALLYAVAMGLSMGAGAMVARRIGEKDPGAAATTAVQAIAVGVAAAIVMGVGGALAAPHLLGLMGASPSVVATGTGFTTLMLGGCINILLLFLMNAIFRGAGDAAIAMRVLWLANAVNLVLDPCFIFGWGPFPELGVTGAAVATNTGRGIGVLYQFYLLSRGRGRIVIARRHLRLDPAVMLRLVRVSGSGIVQVLIGTASWIGLVRIISRFGSTALAGYTIGLRVILFALLPSWGMSNAAATMVGQNLGAGKPERAERAVWTAGFYNMAFLGVVAIVFVGVPRAIVGIFTSDAAVLAAGSDCLRIVACGFLFYAHGMVLLQAFNGAGDTFTPTLINLGCFWLWEIPLAWALAVPAGLGPRGAFIAITVAFSTVAVVGAILFKRGKWKTRKV